MTARRAFLKHFKVLLCIVFIVKTVVTSGQDTLCKTKYSNNNKYEFFTGMYNSSLDFKGRKLNNYNYRFAADRSRRNNYCQQAHFV